MTKIKPYKELKGQDVPAQKLRVELVVNLTDLVVPEGVDIGIFIMRGIEDALNQADSAWFTKASVEQIEYHRRRQ